MYDAVNLFATSLHGLVTTQTMGSMKIVCDDIKPWVHGYSLINYMRVVCADNNNNNNNLFDVNDKIRLVCTRCRWSWTG